MLHILTTVHVAIDVRSTRVFVKSRKLAANRGISMQSQDMPQAGGRAGTVQMVAPQMCVVLVSSRRSIHVHCSMSCTPRMTRNDILHLEQVARSGRIRKWLETSGVGPAIAGRNTAAAHAPGFPAPMDPRLYSSLMFSMWYVWPILSRGPNLSSLAVLLPRM